MNASPDAGRATRLVFWGAALGTTSLFAAFTVAPLLAKEITGSNAVAGIPGAAAVAGTALGAAMLSVVMGRRGRAAGLRLGYALGLAGAFGAVIALRRSAFWAMVIAMAVLGIGHASNQLARFAAAELHPPERRPSVIGWIVWAATIGSVLGPNLPGLFGWLAERMSLRRDGAGFLVAIAFYAGALALASRVRTAASRPADAGEARPPSLRASFADPELRTAMIVMVVAQTTMVLIMTMTPVHVRGAGHGLGVVGVVMSAHFVGMYALAPVAGSMTARFGSRPIMAIGLTVLFAAAIGSGLLGSVRPGAMGTWLFLLGLGWNLAFVGGSATLTGGLTYRARVKAQGAVDTLAWTVAAAASALSGVLLAAFGFRVLALAGAALVLVPVGVIAGRPAPVRPAA
ncbi:MAG TPA: MFS transporter [Actinomycetota bacterium]